MFKEHDIIIKTLSVFRKEFTMKKRFFGTMLFTIGCFLFGGCSAPSFPGLSSFTYSNADKYTMGDAELPAGEISCVEIDWVSGEINVEYHKKDTVIFSETANKKLDDDTTMYYFVDGDTLHLKFIKSGKHIPSKLSKELTLYLPEGLELDEVVIDSVSADINVSELTAEKANIDTVSGDIVFEDVTLSEQVKFDTTSGDITTKLMAAKNIEADSTSGNVQITTKEASDMISLDTVSGDIELTIPGAEKLELDSTSGQIKLSAGEAPDALSIDTVSGDILLILPENSSFTVDWDTASGSINSDFAMKKDGDSYIFGEGTLRYNVDTTSGDLEIKCK